MVFAGDFGRFFALGGGLGGGRVLARFESWRRLGSLAFSRGILAVLWALFGRRRRGILADFWLAAGELFFLANFWRAAGEIFFVFGHLLLARRRRAFFWSQTAATAAAARILRFLDGDF